MLQVNGGQLPPHVVPFCIVAAAVAACLPLGAFFLQRASLRLQLEEARSLTAAEAHAAHTTATPSRVIPWRNTHLDSILENHGDLLVSGNLLKLLWDGYCI